MGGKVLVFVESDSRAMPCVSDHQCRKKICKGPLYQSNAVDSESPDPFKMTSHIIFCKTIQDREDPMQESSQVMLVVKNPPANAGETRDAGSIPGSGRSPGEGNGYPLQYSCLENPKDREAWPATVQRVTKSQTQLKRLSMHRHM